jgi:putative Mg2+ transporter-C (MgtC) family protein
MFYIVGADDHGCPQTQVHQWGAVVIAPTNESRIIFLFDVYTPDLVLKSGVFCFKCPCTKSRIFAYTEYIIYYFRSVYMQLYFDVIIKLLLSLVLGGIVGYEREHKSRPAGLRTHILVCIGAALVQITSLDYLNAGGIVTDPMRLGAQVISGIGFLGAGTILKEGANIKGLTTAASIWVIGCIGLAVGTGLYFEGTAATILIYIALRGFKRIEDRMARDKKYVTVEVTAENKPGKLGEIGSLLGNLNIQIINVDMSSSEEDTVIITFALKMEYIIPIERIIGDIMHIAGVVKAKQL